MNSNNQNFQNSLRCLQHPLSLLSIAILLLNDHIFKVLSPSWLTGKLGDFAGLFFFPFIVAAGISLVADSSGSLSGHIGQIAIGVTALLFLLLKVSASANSLGQSILSIALNRPVQIILDSTDVFALIILLPSWFLWHHQSCHNTSTNKLSYVFLLVGLISCLATSPAPAPTVVTSLLYYDEILFAEDNYSSGMIIRSADYGDTWDTCLQEECLVVRELFSTKDPTTKVCNPTNGLECYRIATNMSVENSLDGGLSWRIGWEIPEGRRNYVDRLREGSLLFGPQDMIIMAAGERQLLIVAMGFEGILRKELSNGQWKRIRVLDAKPIPYFANDIGDVFNVIWIELLIWVGISLILLICFGYFLWRIFSYHNIDFVDWLDWALPTMVLVPIFATGGLILGAIIIVILIFWLGISGFFVERPTFVIALFLSAFLVVSIYLRARNWLQKLVRDHSIRARLLLITLSITIGTSALGAAVWSLWAVGIIYDYVVAQYLAIFCTFVVNAMGYYFAYRLSKI